MSKINLSNRDKADLWLEKIKDIDSVFSKWKLHVDKDHQYCLDYVRIIGNFPDDIEAVDPSGGPFLAVGDKLKDDKGKMYKIITIINSTTFRLSEENIYK